MDFTEKINNDLKVAMLSRDKLKTETLRSIKKELIELKTAKGSTGEVDEPTALKLIQKMIKQRTESASIYHQQNRPDLAVKEELEVAILAEYLPTQLSIEAVKASIQTIIDGFDGATIKDMGRVIGEANKQLAGKAEGKLISGIVKELLSK